jgi:hypothetical protein
MLKGFKWVAATLLLWAVSAAGSEKDALVGTWVSTDGSITLAIASPTELSYNGQPFRCNIDERAIYVVDAQGLVTPYFYRTDGERLELLYPEGSVVLFVRQKEARGRPPKGTAEGDGAPGGEAQPHHASQNHLLQGRFCSFSSSSGGGSSYSSTYWAQFDGRGNFVYGSGAYYSGGGDLYADGRGTYEVQGDTIVLRYPDGSSDRAYVYHRYGGRITEIKYGSRVYAPQLCE